LWVLPPSHPRFASELFMIYLTIANQIACLIVILVINELYIFTLYEIVCLNVA
jgi:hypothetical protein